MKFRSLLPVATLLILFSGESYAAAGPQNIAKVEVKASLREVIERFIRIKKSVDNDSRPCTFEVCETYEGAYIKINKVSENSREVRVLTSGPELGTYNGKPAYGTDQINLLIEELSANKTRITLLPSSEIGNSLLDDGDYEGDDDTRSIAVFETNGIFHLRFTVLEDDGDDMSVFELMHVRVPETNDYFKITSLFDEEDAGRIRIGRLESRVDYTALRPN